jgi:translation initiation factor IF-1
MIKKETFVLDAVLGDVIKNATFNAVLPNGHEIVAFPQRKDLQRAVASLTPGSRVRVEVSPFDMSRGAFVLE